MDYRNDNRTPRDRIDDEFFRRMLRDEEGESLRRGTRMGRQNDYRASRRDPVPSGWHGAVQRLAQRISARHGLFARAELYRPYRAAPCP